jgi:hypothetical protein
MVICLILFAKNDLLKKTSLLTSFGILRQAQYFIPGGHAKIGLLCVIVKQSCNLCGQKTEPSYQHHEKYRHHQSSIPSFADKCPENADDERILWYLLQDYRRPVPTKAV